jgi:hypothetical protein
VEAQAHATAYLLAIRVSLTSGHRARRSRFRKPCRLVAPAPHGPHSPGRGIPAPNVPTPKRPRVAPGLPRPRVPAGGCFSMPGGCTLACLGGHVRRLLLCASDNANPPARACAHVERPGRAHLSRSVYALYCSLILISMNLWSLNWR